MSETETTPPAPTSVSLRDLAFVRDVLIPRVSWVRGDEIDQLLHLRERLDAVLQAFSKPAPERQEAPPC